MATETVSETATDPQRRRWTLAEYHQLADTGMFDGQRVELVEGDVLVMSPQKHRHAVSLSLTCDVLRDVFGGDYWIRSQMPLSLGTTSEPEPDVAVLRGAPRDYSQHPDSALLIVEISDTTLSSDRDKKATLYANAGIEDYWIVNLVNRQLEVFRNPQPGEKAHYAESVIVDETKKIAPLAMPDACLAVADLLP